MSPIWTVLALSSAPVMVRLLPPSPSSLSASMTPLLV
jgi:hypothetical protein